MATKWTDINESIQTSRHQSELVFESDMTELEASMAISEAISFSAEAKYISEGLFNDILNFNEKAEARDYSVVEYISEAFSIGGVFKKIIDFMVKIWGTIVNFFKGLFKDDVSGSSSGGSSSAVTKAKADVNKAAEEIIVELKTFTKKEKKDNFYRQKAAEEKQKKADENKAAEEATQKPATPAPVVVRAVKVSKTRGIYDQITNINAAINKIKDAGKADLGAPCTKGKKYKVKTSDDEVYSLPIVTLIGIIAAVIGKDDAETGDLNLAMKSIESLLGGSGKDSKTRAPLNKDIAVRLGRDLNGIIATASDRLIPSVKPYYKKNAALFSGKDMQEILRKIAGKIDSDSKNVTNSETLMDWLDYIDIMSATAYTEVSVSRIDTIGARASEVFARVKAMQDTISKLSQEANPDMSQQTIQDFNNMSSKLTAYQTNIQDMLTRGVGFCIQSMQRHLDALVSEFNKFKATVSAGS